jgi:hypothetical protein
LSRRAFGSVGCGWGRRCNRRFIFLFHLSNDAPDFVEESPLYKDEKRDCGAN